MPLPRAVRTLLIGTWILVLLPLGSCQDRPPPKVAAEASTLKQATDVFWALDRLGYITSKEKPNPSSRGCTPYEYLAKRGEALFKISVFECGDAAQAKALVEHPDNQKVDSLLRNHHEGGMLQRGPLHIIIRKSSGDAKAADTLLEELGGL